MTEALRVLLVEDSDDDAMLVLRELEREIDRVDFARVQTAEAMNAALLRHRPAGPPEGLVEWLRTCRWTLAA